MFSEIVMLQIWFLVPRNTRVSEWPVFTCVTGCGQVHWANQPRSASLKIIVLWNVFIFLWEFPKTMMLMHLPNIIPRPFITCGLSGPLNSHLQHWHSWVFVSNNLLTFECHHLMWCCVKNILIMLIERRVNTNYTEKMWESESV